MKEIINMKKNKIAICKKSDQIQSKLDSLLNRVSDKISDLHTVKEESERDQNEDEDLCPSRFGSEIGGPSETIRTKEGAREFGAEYMIQMAIEEFIFDHSIKVEKVKTFL